MFTDRSGSTKALIMLQKSQLTVSVCHRFQSSQLLSTNNRNDTQLTHPHTISPKPFFFSHKNHCTYCKFIYCFHQQWHLYVCLEACSETSYFQKTNQQGLLTLERKMHWGHLKATFQYLKEGYEKDGDRFFIRTCSDRTRDNVLNWR